MVTSFSKMADRVEELADDMADNFDDATDESTKALQNSVRRHLTSNDSVARGQLLRDIRRTNLAVTGNIATGYAVHLPEWAKYLEYGTGQRGQEDSARGSIPFPSPDPLPPFDPILQWVLAKNLTPTEYSGKYALAEAIQRTIGEEGTFPHPFIRPAWRGPRGKRGIIAANKDALSQSVRDI